MPKIKKEEYFKRVNKKYNYFFSYNNDYIGIKEKIVVICPKHGKFEILADGHLHGKDGGCKRCQTEKRLKQYREKHSKQFIQKAKEIHGDTYDYSLVKYVKNTSKVRILCKNHGQFYISPASHLNGRGCKKCGALTMGGNGLYTVKVAERNKTNWLKETVFVYLINLYNDKECFIKLGITNKEKIARRFSNLSTYKIGDIFKIKTNKYNATLIEQKLHKELTEYKYTPNIKFKGHTECYNKEKWKNIKSILLGAQLETNYLE